VCVCVCDFSMNCCVSFEFAFLFFFELQGIVRLKNKRLAAPWLLVDEGCNYSAVLSSFPLNHPATFPTYSIGVVAL